jgi:hypothetical protein
MLNEIMIQTILDNTKKINEPIINIEKSEVVHDNNKLNKILSSSDTEHLFSKIFKNDEFIDYKNKEVQNIEKSAEYQIKNSNFQMKMANLILNNDIINDIKVEKVENLSNKDKLNFVDSYSVFRNNSIFNSNENFANNMSIKSSIMNNNLSLLEKTENVKIKNLDENLKEFIKKDELSFFITNLKNTISFLSEDSVMADFRHGQVAVNEVLITKNGSNVRATSGANNTAVSACHMNCHANCHGSRGWR